MSKEPTIILAVNPGSRYIGFAAFRGAELLDWGLRVNRANTSRGKTRVAGTILTEAIERFRPHTLALKRLHPSRSSPVLDGLTDSIAELASRRRIRVRVYSIEQLKTAVLGKANGNKRQLSEQVAALYPVLSHDLQKEMANLNPYHHRMFEAVALGVVCYRHAEE